jgi:hypothetical protein
VEAGEDLFAGDGVAAAIVASVAADVGLDSGDESVLVVAGKHLVAVFAGQAEGHGASLGWAKVSILIGAPRLGQAVPSPAYASRWLIRANPTVRARAA